MIRIIEHDFKIVTIQKLHSLKKKRTYIIYLGIEEISYMPKMILGALFRRIMYKYKYHFTDEIRCVCC